MAPTEPLDFVTGVRRRPGMYVGDTHDGSGVTHLVLELIANAIDQAFAGRCTRAEIVLGHDGTVTVTDDGPGLRLDGGDGVPPLVELFTRPSSRATVDGHRPHVHLGLGGLGLPVLCALSETLEVTSVRAGLEVSVAFARGVVTRAPSTRATTRPSGTTIRYRPDPDCFASSRIPPLALTRQLEDLSFLVPALRLSWRFDGDAGANGGLAAMVRSIDARLDVAHHRGRFGTAAAPIDVEVALAWRGHDPAADPVIHAFVNCGRVTDPASQHVRGLFDGIRRALNLTRAHAAPGLVAAVAVVLADVTFGQPNHSRLDSPAARPAASAATKAALSTWSAAHPARAAALRALRA